MTLETFTINGATQFALVRGQGPLVLIVQSGPGFPLIHEADALESRLHLEHTHRVVYWDQRGTGLSVTSAPITMELLISDVAELSNQLCTRFNVATLDVVGFSLGGSLAMLASARTKSIGRVIAIGPDIDLPASEAFAWNFAREQAIRRGHTRALKQLDAIGHPPHDTPERFMTRVKWVTNFGGIEAGASFLKLFATVLFRLLRSPHYSLRQVIAALKSMQSTQAQVLKDFGTFSLWQRVTSLDVPFTLIQGRLDAAAPPALAEQFINALTTTAEKRLVFLEASAHSPQFDEPARFAAVLTHALSS